MTDIQLRRSNRIIAYRNSKKRARTDDTAPYNPQDNTPPTNNSDIEPNTSTDDSTNDHTYQNDNDDESTNEPVEEDDEENGDNEDDEDGDDGDDEADANNDHLNIGVDHPALALFALLGGATAVQPASIIGQKTRKLLPIETVLSPSEKIYFDSLSNEMKNIANTSHVNIVNVKNISEKPLRFQLMESSMCPKIKSTIIRKLNMLAKMETQPSSEYYKLLSWVTKVSKIPFGVIRSMPVTINHSKCEIATFLNSTRCILDENVHGHIEAKKQIVRIVAQRIANPHATGNVIGIHGSPGVGKTTLIKHGVCKALDLPFGFIPLGGANDSSYLDGHSYTYEGSCPGRITELLENMDCMNPVLYFDELDKVSKSARGQEIINVLVHLTDSTQNDAFHDKYFADVPFDLSKALIIFTYNDPSAIDPVLMDRMFTIHTRDYDVSDKLKIVQNHVFPAVLKDYGFTTSQFELPEDVIRYIISQTTHEAGVRNLKRTIESIVSNINLEILTGTNTTYTDPCNTSTPLIITKEIVDTFITPKDAERDIVSHMYI